MEDELVNLRLVDEEDDPVCDPNEVEEVEEEFNFCLVGKVLTQVNTRKMEQIRRKCIYEFDIDVGAEGTRVGLSLGWRGNIVV